MLTELTRESRTVDQILDNLFYILPVIRKKFLSADLGSVAGNLSRLHLAIMRMLAEESLPISEIARRLLAPKSHLTRLVDHLAEQDIVARLPDDKDRRVINVNLTEHGHTVLRQCQALVRQDIRSKLSNLTPDELAELAGALEKLREMGTKLE